MARKSSQRVPVDISEGFYQSFSAQEADLKCVNLYPFVPDSPAYSQTGLRFTEGLLEKTDTTFGTGRGSIKIGTIPYFVQGNSLSTLSSGSTITRLGTIVGTGPVSMAQNGTILWIVVPGVNSYFLTISTGVLTLNVDPNFLGPATSVDFKDGFFVFTTDLIFFNANLDGISFTPTDFGVAEVDSDVIVRAFVNHNQLYILGTESIQVFQTPTVATAGFPFLNVKGAVVEKGLSARFGIVEANSTFFFLGSDENEIASIYRFVGNDAVDITSPAISDFIQDLPLADIEACIADTWSMGGEEFIQFGFPTRTFVYLVRASAKKGRHIWHEKESNGTQWRGIHAIKAFGQILFLDNIDSKIGILDKNTFTEYGEVKTRLFTTQPFNQNGEVFFARQYEMVMETGVGNSDSTNPVVDHSFSDNGVNFFQTTNREIGEAGQFDTRLVWRRMGRIPRQRVLEFKVTEPCKVVFYRIEANING